MNTKYFLVAGHRFSINANEKILGLMSNYKPFVAEGGDTVFALTIERGEPVSYIEELRQEDEGQDIICGKNGDNPVFEFRWRGHSAGCLECTPDYREATLTTTGFEEKMALDNALMVLYALATASLKTALFHAAVVSYQGKAYMFLGKSGTGKSTHASLWLRYIQGTELVNDDNPVAKLTEEGTAMVYGSPWSGKTPCYRNVSYPIGGIVQLSQAPHNKIKPLGNIAAYAVLVPSISGKRWDKMVADGLHQTENELIMATSIWHMECLPDEAAATLCNKTIAQ